MLRSLIRIKPIDHWRRPRGTTAPSASLTLSDIVHASGQKIASPEADLKRGRPTPPRPARRRPVVSSRDPGRSGAAGADEVVTGLLDAHGGARGGNVVALEYGKKRKNLSW